MLKNLCLLTLLCAPSSTAFALDEADQKALAETQRMMTDPQALKSFTKDSPDAAKALDQVKTMTNGNAQQMGEVNKLSSDIFADMAKANNGASPDIQANLQKALADPGAFIKSLTPEQQARIRSLASEIDKKNGDGGKKVP